MEDDTIKLLRECNAGVKMGISSLNEVLEHVRDEHLKQLMKASRETHSRLGETIHRYLEKYNDEGKEPNPMAKMMSWAKTNFKLGEEESDRTAADLITDGCNMGIKSLYRYLHQYQAADQESKDITMELIKAEETLVKDLRDYL